MYLLIVCLFTKILTFHVLFKHGILWIVLLEIFLRFPPLTEQRYFVEEHSFTNETVFDGSSVAFSEIAATTEVSTLLKAFGLDVQRNLRNSHNIHVPFNCLSVYQNSYFPCTIQAWNSLDSVLTAENTWPILFSFFYSTTCIAISL
jgi:hypothetical protein